MAIETHGDRLVFRAGDQTTTDPWVALRIFLAAWQQDREQTQARLDQLQKTLYEVRREVGHRGGS